MGPKHAIILAGGIGSRMLPASSLIPKEIMPLIDTPAINYTISEIKNAGIKNIHLVINEQKLWMTELLISNHDNIQNLKKIRPDLSENILNPIKDVKFHVHIQKEQLGFANAISYAIESISGPFLVLLGDNLLMKSHLPPTVKIKTPRSNASLKLIEKYKQNKLPVVGLHEVPYDELSSFGVVKKINGKITDIIEKPNPEEAPSNSVLCGRYLFTEDFKDLLTKFPVQKYGELQSIEIQKYWMEEVGLDYVDLDDHEWYDSGRPEMWLKAQIDHALNRSDIKSNLEEWLKKKLMD